MKILILNWRDMNHPKAGGAEFVTMQHARLWVKLGHSVTWITSGYSGTKRHELIEGVEFIRQAGSWSIYLIAPFYLLLFSHRFDVIVDEVHGIPFYSPLFTRSPVVVFIHEIANEIWDYMFVFPLNKIGKLLEKLYFWLYRNNYFWTDAISTVDELVAYGIPRRHCYAIPCPPEKLTFPDLDKEKKPTYIFLSRLVRMKGVEEVIKAFAFISTVQNNAQLWIVGNGDSAYVERLKEMVNDYHINPFVKFWGKVDQKTKMKLLAKAHLLLHASVKEGWGLVVLEAALAGTPTVAYNVSGLKDVVIHNVSGIVLLKNSPQEMAQSVVRLVNDNNSYQRMRQAGKKWAKSLSWDTTARQSMALLEAAAQHKS